MNKWLKTFKLPGKPNEWETKQLFASRGIPIPTGKLFTPDMILSGGISPPESPSPWVAKICHPEILHKTDCGGVILGLTEKNWALKVKELAKRFPECAILMEAQLAIEGPEFIAGALVDPVFGPAVMFGAGGILTELYKDVSFRLAPLDEHTAGQMLEELTISEVLKGYRGSEMDPTGLAKLLVTLGDIAHQLGERFSQMDINPVAFDGTRWIALDGVLILNQE